METLDLSSLQQTIAPLGSGVSEASRGAPQFNTLQDLLKYHFKPMLKISKGIYITQVPDKRPNSDKRQYFLRIKRSGITLIKKSDVRKDEFFYRFKTGEFMVNNIPKDDQEARAFVMDLHSIINDVKSKKAVLFEEE